MQPLTEQQTQRVWSRVMNAQAGPAAQMNEQTGSGSRSTGSAKICSSTDMTTAMAAAKTIDMATDFLSSLYSLAPKPRKAKYSHRQTSKWTIWATSSLNASKRVRRAISLSQTAHRWITWTWLLTR